MSNLMSNISKSIKAFRQTIQVKKNNKNQNKLKNNFSKLYLKITQTHFKIFNHLHLKNNRLP